MIALWLCLALSPAAAAKGPSGSAAFSRPEEAIRRYEEFIAKGDVQRARQALDAAVAANPDHYPLVLRYAQAHYLLGEYRTAEQFYERALKLQPREDAPLAGLYLVARAKGDPKWRSRASALALSSPYLDVNYPLAADSFERGEHREALKRYEAVLRLRPDDPDALTGRGWCRYYLGDRRAAQRDFRRALAKRPGHRPALQGIDASRTVGAAVGYCFASIDYRGNALKRSGTHHCLPFSLAYDARVWVSANFSRTTIDWVEPAADTVQSDFNLMVGVLPKPWASVWVATNLIDGNDLGTDGSQSWTGGFLVQPGLGGSVRLLAGASISSSWYRDHDMFQVSPRVGAAKGKVSAAFFASHITDGRTNERFSSWGATAAVGPLAGLTAGGRAWRGKRRGYVEDGGVVVYNSLSDTFLSGWQVSVSYDAAGRGSAFLRYGEDDLAVDYGLGRLRYTAGTVVTGVNLRFGH
ncbi:MAG: tetratricopeptide repeat protein [Elusimicrobia bacterium]|nr:tetratricopeptide repeat protein [Elusimicrobiota bacterium]